MGEEVGAHLSAPNSYGALYNDPVSAPGIVMLLALDIGNTNISIGVFDESGGPPEYRPGATWRIATDRARLADEYGLLISSLLESKGMSPGEIDSVAICSGVPPLTGVLVEVCDTHFGTEPLVVGAGVSTGIKVLYDSPRDVGADRIADAAAALTLYGGPAIVVDFGTATVFDAVRANGEYVGGAIAPGVAVAADALFHSASLLRRVELERPPSAIGRNTVHALQSGLVLGYSDMVKGMVARFDEELGGGSTVVATGGLAGLIESEAKVFDHVAPNLTLTGLRIIQERNP